MNEKEIYNQFLNETKIPEENIIDYRYCIEFYAGVYIENAIIIQFKKDVYDFEHLVYVAKPEKSEEYNRGIKEFIDKLLKHEFVDKSVIKRLSEQMLINN